jgi:chromosome segregation protein
VSKTVSMRFNQERGEAEAHAPNLAESVRGARPPVNPAAAGDPAGDAA